MLIINITKLVAVALNLDKKAFVIYVIFLKPKILIYLACKI